MSMVKRPGHSHKPDAKPVTLNTESSWYENNEAIFPSHNQPALLMDLLHAQGIDSHRFLRGSGLFIEDVIGHRSLLSAQQFITLTRNAEPLYQSPELPFRWGQLIWPGHFGSFSELLASSPNLHQFLCDLERYRKVLCPLLSPRIHYSKNHCTIEWNDAVGLGAAKPFFVAAYCSALSSATEQLAGRKLPWLFAFSKPRPSAEAAYQAYLGPQQHFGWGVDVAIIDKQFLHQPWGQLHNRNTITRSVVEHQCSQSYADPARSFLECVQSFLIEHIRTPVNQEYCAEALGISLTTFKRKFKQHNTSFQAQHDQVRMQACFQQFFFEGKSNEDVARYLNFSDTTNFRRAFKRWCGLTPSSSKALYGNVLLQAHC